MKNAISWCVDRALMSTQDEVHTLVATVRLAQV